MSRITDKVGMAKLCIQGLFAWWLHVELITARLFAIVSAFMLSSGASRSHLNDPIEKHILPEHKEHEKSKHGTCLVAFLMPTAKGRLVRNVKKGVSFFTGPRAKRHE